MNKKILGIRVNTVGMQTVLLETENDQLIHINFDYFLTPKIYDFSNDISKILKWHRNHLITTIHSDTIKHIAIKRTERASFQGRPRDSDIQRMYIEGMVLSLAGEHNLINHSYYKTTLNKVLTCSDYAEETKAIAGTLGVQNINEIETDALAVALALEKK